MTDNMEQYNDQTRRLLRGLQQSYPVNARAYISPFLCVDPETNKIIVAKTEQPYLFDRKINRKTPDHKMVDFKVISFDKNMEENNHRKHVDEERKGNEMSNEQRTERQPVVCKTEDQGENKNETSENANKDNEEAFSMKQVHDDVNTVNAEITNTGFKDSATISSWEDIATQGSGYLDENEKEKRGVERKGSRGRQKERTNVHKRKSRRTEAYKKRMIKLKARKAMTPCDRTCNTGAVQNMGDAQKKISKQEGGSTKLNQSRHNVNAKEQVCDSTADASKKGHKRAKESEEIPQRQTKQNADISNSNEEHLQSKSVAEKSEENITDPLSESPAEETSPLIIRESKHHTNCYGESDDSDMGGILTVYSVNQVDVHFSVSANRNEWNKDTDLTPCRNKREEEDEDENYFCHMHATDD